MPTWAVTPYTVWLIVISSQGRFVFSSSQHRVGGRKVSMPSPSSGQAYFHLSLHCECSFGGFQLCGTGSPVGLPTSGQVLDFVSWPLYSLWLPPPLPKWKLKVGSILWCLQGESLFQCSTYCPSFLLSLRFLLLSIPYFLAWSVMHFKRCFKNILSSIFNCFQWYGQNTLYATLKGI